MTNSWSSVFQTKVDLLTASYFTVLASALHCSDYYFTFLLYKAGKLRNKWHASSTIMIKKIEEKLEAERGTVPQETVQQSNTQ